MSYKDYTLATASDEFGIRRITVVDEEYKEFNKDFLGVKEKFCMNKLFETQIEFRLRAYKSVNVHSEIGLRESLIYPFLDEAWVIYFDYLHLWQGISVNVPSEERLSGVPDYFVTKKSDSPKTPYCIVGEAKKDNFETGWGQCLAGMKASQILNKEKGISEIPIYGIVTSGIYWEFGKLIGDEFSIYPDETFNIKGKDGQIEVLTNLDMIFRNCKENASKEK